MAYSKFQKTRQASDYSIDHSALVYFMGKDGEYITHFAYGTPRRQMTEKLCVATFSRAADRHTATCHRCAAT